MPLSQHSTTNIDVIRQFLGVAATVTPESPTRHVVEIAAAR